jgi:type IV secretory pathway TrbL component
MLNNSRTKGKIIQGVGWGVAISAKNVQAIGDVMVGSYKQTAGRALKISLKLLVVRINAVLDNAID